MASDLRGSRADAVMVQAVAQLQHAAGNHALQRAFNRRTNRPEAVVQRQSGASVQGGAIAPTLDECARTPSGTYFIPGSLSEKVERAVAAAHFEDAFCLLDGMPMWHMLHTLDLVGSGTRSALTTPTHWAATSGYRRDRLRVAFQAIGTGDICKLVFPADLPPAEQVVIKSYIRTNRPPVTTPYLWQIGQLRDIVEGSTTWHDVDIAIQDLFRRLAPRWRQVAEHDLEGGRIAYNAGGRVACAEALNRARYAIYANVAVTQMPGRTAPATQQPPGAAPRELLAGTHEPSSAARGRIRDALAPPRAMGPGGTLAPFRSLPPGAPASYETRVRERLTQRINDLHARVGAPRTAAAHSDPTRVDPMSRLAQIANAAKAEADRVYRSYRVGPPFVPQTAATPGGNLRDWWEEADRELGAYTTPQLDSRLNRWANYLIVSDGPGRDPRTIEGINAQHNAIPSRTTLSPGEPESEATILERVRRQMVNDPTRRQQLAAIYRGWDAMQRPGTTHVFLQRFRVGDAHADRFRYWDIFQTAIHEYMHSLMHGEYRGYARSFAGGEQSEQYNTLVEGVACLLAETVWPTVVPRVSLPALRAQVEGPPYDAQPFDPTTVPEPRWRRYPSHDRAMRLADIVGIRNLYAAFFLGHVRFIRAAP